MTSSCHKWLRKSHLYKQLQQRPDNTWWRHQIETFSALLALYAANSPVTGDLSHNGQWRGALTVSLICAWTNAWVNHRSAGDLRRHRAHYDVTVMITPVPCTFVATDVLIRKMVEIDDNLIFVRRGHGCNISVNFAIRGLLVYFQLGLHGTEFWRNEDMAYSISLCIMWRHMDHITMASHERYAVSNHRQLDCLGGSLFVLTTKLRIGDSFFPHKGPVMPIVPTSWRQDAHHYSGVIMGAMASQFTSLTIVYSTDYSGADQRTFQSSTPLAIFQHWFR